VKTDMIKLCASSLIGVVTLTLLSACSRSSSRRMRSSNFVCVCQQAQLSCVRKWRSSWYYWTWAWFTGQCVVTFHEKSRYFFFEEPTMASYPAGIRGSFRWGEAAGLW